MRMLSVVDALRPPAPPGTVFAEGRPDTPSVVVLVVLLVTCSAFLPLTLRLQGRARRCAAEHEDVLAPN